MNGETVRISTCLVFVLFPLAVYAAVPSIVIKSQNTLNDQVALATNPSLMKDAKRLRSTKSDLDARALEWKVVPENLKDNFSACRDALERASYVAELSAMKANQGLNDRVFDLEKAKLNKLADQCRRYTAGG